MHRFLLRPKWILFHLVVAAAVVAMINLGLWQLRRLDERREFNAVVTSRLQEPTRPLEDVLASGLEPDRMQWLPVTVKGEYVPGEDVTVVNRSQGGLAGQNTVTPLRLADGRIVLINRGFSALEESTPPAPGGTVTVEGHVRASQSRRFGQLSDASEGDLTTAQRVDIPRLAPQMPGEVVAVYVDLVSSTPPDGPPPYPVPLPELTEANHLSYAVQWFIFAVAAVAGWVFAVRRSIRTRRAAATRTAARAEGESESVETRTTRTG